MIKIATITGSKNDPSSRYRIRQYTKELCSKNIYIDDYYSRFGKFPPMGKIKRLLWGAAVLIERLIQIVKINSENYDCVILQREMISTVHTFERFLRAQVILDVDDAIFLKGNGNFIKEIAEQANCVICGNIYLNSYFSKYNKNTYIVPTSIDTEILKPSETGSTEKNRITIGWVGTSGGFRFIYLIEEALQLILENHPNVDLLIVSNSRPSFKSIKNYEYIEWDEGKEVENFHRINIGIMPLANEEWAKGKCSFKMLQYMACGLPVVASNIGMNAEVFSKGDVGFPTEDYYNDWIDALETLINDKKCRIEKGREGRRVVLENYSLEKCAGEVADIIKKIAR